MRIRTVLYFFLAVLIAFLVVAVLMHYFGPANGS
jgi:hypothetical protein